MMSRYGILVSIDDFDENVTGEYGILVEITEK